MHAAVNRNFHRSMPAVAFLKKRGRQSEARISLLHTRYHKNTCKLSNVRIHIPPLLLSNPPPQPPFQFSTLMTRNPPMLAEGKKHTIARWPKANSMPPPDGRRPYLLGVVVMWRCDIAGLCSGMWCNGHGRTAPAKPSMHARMHAQPH